MVSIPKTTKPSNNFEIQIANVMNIGSPNKMATAPSTNPATILSSSYILPTNVVITGTNITTLGQLILYVGSNNISIDYYVRIRGSVAGVSGTQQRSINLIGTMANGVPTGEASYSLNLTSGTVQNIGNGCLAPLNSSTATCNITNGSGWILLQQGANSLINQLKFVAGCSSGCGSFSGYNCSIDLGMQVTINMINFCTTGTNIQIDSCYDYIGAYITSPSYGPTNQISTYLANYCNNQFPDGNLSLFNTNGALYKSNIQDYNLCACNMPQNLYIDLAKDIEKKAQVVVTTPAQCLLPACDNSNFKNVNSGLCPGPECLNVAVIENSYINGSLTFNQKNACFAPSGSSPTGSSPPGSPPSDTLYVLIGITILVFLVVLAFFIIALLKNKK
jgi:hypothetical protein